MRCALSRTGPVLSRRTPKLKSSCFAAVSVSSSIRRPWAGTSPGSSQPGAGLNTWVDSSVPSPRSPSRASRISMYQGGPGGRGLMGKVRFYLGNPRFIVWVAAMVTGGFCLTFALRHLSLSTSSGNAFLKPRPKMGENPLLALSSDQLFPPYGLVKPEHVEPAMEDLLAEAYDSLKKLESDIDADLDSLTYEKLARTSEAFEDRLSRAWGVVNHLKSVADDPDLRKSIEKMQPKVIDFGLKMGQSEALYRGWTHVSEKEASTLTGSQKRIVENSILSAKLGGVALKGEQKEKFNASAKRLGELSTKFSNNILDATKAFTVILLNKSETDGLPESSLALAAQTCKSKLSGKPEEAAKAFLGAKGAKVGDEKREAEIAKLCESATAENGPWLLTLDHPSYLPVLQHSKDRALREKMHHASLIRASEFTDLKDDDGKLKDNAPLIVEILALKDEKAKLLGYKNHAEVSLSEKMATLESAKKLIEDLRAASYEPGRKEMADLRQYAVDKHGWDVSKNGELMQWDTTYYSERMKEDLYAFEEEQLKPYFSLPEVQKGLFALAKKLFGVDIREFSWKERGISVWHEDVRMYEIFRDSQSPIAYFYLDPYSRPETKKGGAWMNEVVGRSVNKLLNPKQDGNLRLPVAHMVCNQSPPVGSDPSLMTFREVETLFHEFGHALQHMLTKESEGMASGIRLVEWDSVEQPSQFMENWAYHKPTIDGLAKHYKTGEPIPNELFKKLVRAKNYRAAGMMLRQLHFAQVDLELHSDFDAQTALAALKKGEKPGKSIFDVDKSVGDRFDVLPMLPHDRFLCAFSHIFAGGYAAGYYSYKWAEVLSADCFSAFEEVGLGGEEDGKPENTQGIIETGRRFADTVLGLGGGVDPLEVFKMFRKREPKIDALLRHSGLSGEKELKHSQL